MPWETEDKCIEANDCDYAEEVLKPYTIDLDDDVYRVIRAMCKRFPEHEWQMMLTGVVEGLAVHVTGYAIPKQLVRGSTVKNLDVVNADVVSALHIVATVHSHVNMGVFFSQTDNKDTNLSIIDHHIVVNNKGEYRACSKVHLPCGMVHLLDTEVTIGGQEVEVVDIKGLDNVEVEQTTLVGGWNKDWTGYQGYQTDGCTREEATYYTPKYRKNKKRKEKKIELSKEEYDAFLMWQEQKELEEYNKGFGVDIDGKPVDTGMLGVGL